MLLGQETCTKNAHFLCSNLEHVFHKNLDVFFSKYLDAHARIPCLFIIPHIRIFSTLNVIFVKTFENFVRDSNNYLLGAILLYLEALQSSRLSVPTFVKDNLFCSIKRISQNDPKYKTLFEDYGGNCDVSYCTKARMNTLLVDNTRYKSLFNGPFNAIFVKTFENSIRNINNCLLGVVLHFLEVLQSSKLSAPTFIKDDLFNSKHISWNDHKYKTLFEDCVSNCDVSYCTKARMKMKNKM